MLGDSIRRRRAPGRPGAEDEEARRPARSARARLIGGGDRFPWLTWLGIAALVLLVSFGLGYVLATQFVFPRPDTAGAGVGVPALYGMERESAEETLRRLGLEVGAVTDVASLRVRAGRVLAQDPVPEQQLRPGAAVSLAVSTGPPSLRVPPVLGLPAATAQGLLEAVGFEVEVRQIRTGTVAPGLAARTEPEGGAVVRLPATVALVVSVGPEPVEPGEPVEPVDSPLPSPPPAEWP
jgi:beta-lactam-binding protein with PASTA domain